MEKDYNLLSQDDIDHLIDYGSEGSEDILNDEEVIDLLREIINKENKLVLESKTEKCAAYMRQKMTESINLYCNKNADYGDSFGQSIKEWGFLSALIRIGDKYNRLKSLIGDGKNIQVKDESIEDTLIDLANYSLMLAFELNEKENN